MRCKKLSLLDIVSLKKDLLWGKYYYGYYSNHQLVDSILYSHTYGNKKLIEIHQIEKKHPEFIKEFTNKFTKNHKVRYFIREMSETNQTSDIEFMNSCGFKRYTRNYCFDFNPSFSGLKEIKQLDYYCREADNKDIKQLVEIDQHSQIIDFRDELYRSKKFFKENILNIYVLTPAKDTEQVLAYMIKKELEHFSSFELVLPSRLSESILALLIAFSERYIHFEKADANFRFIIDENHKKSLGKLEKEFKLQWSSQKLILEGRPKEKIPSLSQGISLSQAPAA